MTKKEFRTLIIDDHDSSCFVLERIIKSMGHTVSLAYNSTQARHKILHEEYDLYLVDWTLPDGSGLDLVGVIRAKNPSSFIMMCTGKSETDSIQEAIDSGVDDYLLKPVDKKTVETRIILALKSIETKSQLHLLTEELEVKARKREELVQHLALAELANKRKSEYLANLSHEIRTPINGIISLSTLLLDSSLDTQQKEDLGDLYECAFSLKGIIGDILDFSKIEAGKLAILDAPFNPRIAVDQALVVSRTSAKKREIEIKSTVSDDLSKSLIGDASRLNQIICHLLSNAIKFSQEGSSVHLEVYQQDSKERNKKEVVIKVSDKGIGIPISKREEILLPFIQVDGSSTRRVGGTGLGLTLVKQLSALMNGRFWFESVENEGSIFYVSLPFEVTSPTLIFNLQPLCKNEKAEDRKLKVLIAEDDAINRDTLERILRMKNCEVVAVKNGKEAIKELESNEFNCIILDLQMPLMNGIEALREIKKDNNKNRKIPTIILTACALADEREEAINAGADGFLVKPCDSKVLYDEIERLSGITI